MRHSNSFKLWRWALLGGCWLAGHAATAQILNLGFDQITCTNSLSPFYQGCVPGWSVSHGSPQLHQFSLHAGSNAPHNAAYLWSTATSGGSNGLDGGEGLYYQLANVAPNESYTVKFWAHNAPDGVNTSNINVRLAVKIATGLNPGGTAQPFGTNIPNNVPIIDQGWYNLTNTWTQYSFTFIANSAGPFQVWFYPEYNSNGRFAHMELDRVEINGCHTMDVYYQHNDYNLPVSTVTQGRIKAGTDVTAGSQEAVRVGPGETVEFRTLTEIELRGNVEIEAGAEFAASAMTCPGFTPQAVAAGASTEAGLGTNAARTVAGPAPLPTGGSEPANLPTPCMCLNSGIARPANEQKAIGPDRNPEPVDKAQVLAFPNPANDQLTLPGGAERIELYNPSGKSVLLPARRGNVLDVRGLPEGLYQLRLYVDGKPVTQRIQIKH